MNRRKMWLGSLAAASLLAAYAPAAKALDLPAPNNVNASWYGDGLVYSLGLLNLISTNNASELNGPFTVDSSPGQIADQVVILAGSNGNLVENNVAPSGPFPADSTVADNPFLTPTGQQASTFTTQQGNPNLPPAFVSGTEPNPAITNDNDNSWDIRVTDLLAFLNGADLIYFFDNNQEGSLDEIKLNIWAQVLLVDDQGILPTKCFEIHGTAVGDKTQPGGAATPAVSQCSGVESLHTPENAAPSNNFVLIDSGFCVNATTGVAEACANGNQPGPNQFGQVTNNLGNSRAEFALTIPRLNDCLQNALCIAGYDVLRHVVFYSNNNDGQEQAWISAGEIPVPTTLALLGAGLVALAVATRRYVSPRSPAPR